MQALTKTAAVFAASLMCAAMLPSVVNAQSAAGPTDPQIVGIVVAANQIDIDYAKLALSKSKNKQVRDFAQQMVTDHTALQKAVSDLGAKLKVKPADSDTSESLKSQSRETTSQLKALNGEAFDKAYIDNEIAFHKLVISANSSTLIPNAKNADLKSALTNAQTLFQGHLEHAEKVQASLGGSSHTGTAKHSH